MSPSSVGISVSPPLQDRGSRFPFSVTAPFGFLLDSYGCFLVPMAVANLPFSRSFLFSHCQALIVTQFKSLKAIIEQDGSGERSNLWMLLCMCETKLCRF